jgi:2-keto-4-pentenoate hydratase/2-oxohepta-3-ene-1,7-dioic acid hydratase in catechol pathway
MRICTFQTEDDDPAVGLVVGSVVVALHLAGERLDHDAASLPGDLLSIIAAGRDVWDVAESLDEQLTGRNLEADGRGAWWWPRDEASFRAPFRPRKNPWVLGANYYQHLANGYARIPLPAVVPPHPEFFSKDLDSIIGDGDPIPLDKRATATLDYETEFTCVLGIGGKDIPVSEAHDHIFGYTIANDVSARELQIGHRQYFRGKSLDGFCPLGPVIVTPRHIPNPYALTLRTRVNGQLRQNWPVGDMIYKLDEVISVLSQGMTVEPGETIICGTVPGVGFEQLPQVWLQHGDVVESEISQIGVLRNVVQMVGAGS